ncbi:type I 3-dehydroquinate dehydratase [Halalkalibacter urbisdiaboli]|uniref:type I 3-dehydroquinate dehydratase n=1 Tax=Halalkalibacter urbisdiaboli TaxID=1960589 RepID=UPI000B432AF0|nr:type I 3-dehydroquinate dehydratase [Halalkalibacter urbisdiaboli]
MISSLKAADLIGTEEINQQPLICAPLVGKNDTDILNELTNIRYKKPDVIEWRADFYEDICDRDKVFHILQTMKSKVPNIPILFTIRSVHEGGESIELTERGKVSLLAALCCRGLVDIIDYELRNDVDSIHYLRQISLRYNIQMILSYHNFKKTPECSEIVEMCKKMDHLDADFVKVAVMPNNMDDALELLRATNEVKKSINAKLVTISMGKFGAVSRLFGWVFGSAMTFGIGEQSSAPGQVPVEDVRRVIEITSKYMN